MQARSALVGLVFLATVFAGCRDGASPTSIADPAPAAATSAASPSPASAIQSPLPTPVPTPGPACVTAGPAPAPGTTTALTLVSEGRERSYVLYVPSGYDGATALPLVLNFHGLGSNGAEQHFYAAGLAPIADREGFLIASPDGINRAWLATPGVNDITFTRDLVAAIGEVACVDPARVYATGMSNGGFMSAALACFAGDLVAAVAPVAGLTAPGALCGDPVPFIAFHGTDDRIVPYLPGTLAPTGGNYAGARALMDDWAKFNRCEGEPVPTQVGESVTFREYANCAAPTGYYVVEGGGHTWPGGIPVESLGLTTREISASEIAWAFFEANPRE